MRTKELRFTMKVNIGNFETMEIGKSVLLDEGDSEDKVFAELVASTLSKCGKVVKLIGRENEVLMAEKFPGISPMPEKKESFKESNGIKTIDEFMRDSQNISKESYPAVKSDDNAPSLEELMNYGKE